jgi:hypothetical protein
VKATALNFMRPHLDSINRSRRRQEPKRPKRRPGRT